MSMQPEIWASLISAATALVAVIIAPVITYRAGKRSMLGPMRQAWINELRDTISVYLSLISINRWHTTPSNSNAESQIAAVARIQEAIRLREKILLLLNAKEPKHIQLAKLVESSFELYNTGNATLEIVVELRKFSQVVLKCEWEVVKE
jgi:hypothetical protein